MSRAQNYQRDKNGYRFKLGKMVTVRPLDTLGPGEYAYLQNVRAYLQDQATGRATQDTALYTLGAGVHSLRRLNDSTPLGPTAGYAHIGGAGSILYTNGTQVDTGFSGKPMSFVPFRPNTSVQPWMYVADAAKMDKVNANGTCYAMGIMEPQAAPTVAAQNAIVNGSVTVPSSTRPWLVAGGQNASYPYTATGGTNPVVIACAAGATIALSATGTITTSYGSESASGLGPTSSGSPGFNVAGSFCNVLMGAFTDASGNVVTPTTGSGPVTVGAGPTTLLVPIGATQLQLGIDDTAYVAGTAFTVAYTVTTNAVASAISLLGNVTAYYWGDSPTTGGVATYLWNNPNDPTATANPRSIGNAIGSTTNTSLLFDTPTTGNQNTPMQWTTLASDGSISGTTPVFIAPLSDSPTNNFANFNMCVVGTLYVPTAGTYNFTITSKDNVMWGIGGAATWSGKGSLRGAAGQSITVVSKYALLPSPSINSEGAATAITVAVTFPAPGEYGIELDYDYWYHDGRTLTVTSSGGDGTTGNINPLPVTVLQETQYRYVYRSSATGATSNPSPESAQNQNPVQTSTITPQFSPDPQVDKVDYYRIDSSLDNFTYVGTGPNTNPPTPFVDELLDTSVAANPILQYDNFQPFPVVDTPHRGVANVVAGVATWVSGDKFNTRWLAGTIINSGGISYTLNTRPTSATTLTAIDIADGSNLTYEIDAPLLAGQPMPAMWGPTDDAAFMFACGDTINPGRLYFTKGNNPDSAPSTNTIDLTSPSEPLVNGVIVGGISMVFSTERAWDLYPNYTSALATVTGVTGSQFRPILSISDRGLYIRKAITTDGGKRVFFRTKDGISTASAGGGAQSITDEIYNLFPHEGPNKAMVTPQPITVAGYTIYPPDDTKPDAQQLRFAIGYLYYDYQDTTGNPRTLVYDVVASGWSVDAYQYPATIHVLEEGPANGVLVGCADGSVRPLAHGSAEKATSVILTPAINGGDARADKTLGDIFLRAEVDAVGPLTVAVYKGRFATALTGFAPVSLTSANGPKFIVDFIDGGARDVDDVEMSLAWATGSASILELWQPDWTDLPESSQDRPTDWDDAGMAGNGFWQGLILEADTMGQPKVIRVQSSDDLSLHTPDQSPLTFSGQSKQALTFTPPFIAHSVRIMSTDGVPWRLFGARWTALPFPERTVQWQTEMTSHGMNEWLSLGQVMNIAHISTADITITLVFDQWPTITLTVPNSGGVQTKTKIVVPQNKFKLVSYRASSSQPFYLFANDCEVRVGPWNRTTEYTVVHPFGGRNALSAEV